MLKFLLFGLFSLQIGPISSFISEEDYLLMPDIFSIDNYDRCMLYGEEALYCNIIFQLHPKNTKNPSKTWNIIEEMSSDITNYRHDLLRHGICIPETYPNITQNLYKNRNIIRQKLEEIYNQNYKHLGLRGEITKMRCETKESPYHNDIYNDLFNCFIYLYCAIILAASLYEEIARHHSQEEYNKRMGTSIGKFVSAVSIRKNWIRLMTVNPTSKEVQALSFMQAIRLYIMLTVILCHTAAGYLAGPLTNIFRLERNTKIQSLKPQIDSALSMQTFFLMTSWLLTFSFFREHENSKKIKISYLVKQFLLRYVRLTPVLVFAVLFASTQMVHQGRGPLWDDYVGDTYRKCRINWWTNLLYINNIVNEEEMCLSHTWFLATNTQLYLLNLIILYLMWNYPKKIYYILGSVLGIHVVYLFYIIYKNNWQHMPPVVLEAVYNEQFIKWRQWHALWTSTLANLAGLVTGTFYGYIFYKSKDTEIVKSKICTALYWTLGFCIPLSLAIADQIFEKHDRFSNALYGCLKRIIFSFAVGMAMLMMSKSKGKLINWLYKSEMLYILGRLTYSIYVIHPITQRLSEGSKRTPSSLGRFSIPAKAAGDFTSALMAATLLNLFIEMPVIEMLKWFKTPQKNNKVN